MGVDRTARIVACAGSLVVAVAGVPACAQGAGLDAGAVAAGFGQHTHNAAGLAILIGLTVFATIVALLYMRERGRWTRRERDLLAELSSLRGAHDRAEMLLNAERQLLVTWSGRGVPTVEGDLGLVEGRRPPGSEPAAFPDFETWLHAVDADALNTAVEALRARGTGFRLSLRARSGRFVDAHGRPCRAARSCACARPRTRSANSSTSGLPSTRSGAASPP